MRVQVETSNGVELRELDDLNLEEGLGGQRRWQSNPVLHSGEEAFHTLGGEIFVVKMNDGL